jgi:hypothetical protein
VSPSPRRVRHLAADGSLLSTGMANAITIQMAGSWLPLEDVAGGGCEKLASSRLPNIHTFSWFIDRGGQVQG